MKQGSISIIAGCHSPIHSLIVIRAWKIIYGSYSCWWEICCIFLHDVGHWGKNYLDDYEEKKKHSLPGARIAKRLFGEKGYELIIGHDYNNGSSISKLYLPDKYSWLIAPDLWILSNCFIEPKLKRKGYTRLESVAMFKQTVKKNFENGFPATTHEIYLNQWGHYQNQNAQKRD